MRYIRLQTLNGLRWLRESILFWTILFTVSALTTALLLQGVLGVVFHVPVSWQAVALGVGLTVALGAVLENLPVGAIPLSSGIFSERFWSRIGGRLLPLYLRNELRRGPTWITLGLACMAGAILPRAWAPLWLLLAQWPVQRALHSGRNWQRLVRLHARGPRDGIPNFLVSLAVSQVLQYLLLLAAVWAVPDGALAFANPKIHLAAGGLGAVIGATSVAVEGDSGRPGLVHLISLTAGTLWGLACAAYPWSLGAALYFFSRMAATGRYRLASVEWFDEDTFIS
ncbi:MAG TPA: hypothetical protein VL588_10290 [Bdellovibrionota bacterium]|jgi:hypothetical protein|nr:hypothetical protein [Bdellovibrionota bacterium]